MSHERTIPRPGAPLPGTEAPAPAEAESDESPPVAPVRGATSAFSDIMSVSAARVATLCLAVASVTLVTHLLRPSSYAVLAYVAVISGLMFTTTASWTSTAVTRYGREELERVGSLRGTSWSRLLITAPAAVVAVIGVVGLKLVNALPLGVTWEFTWIAIATGLSAIAGEHVLNLLEASGRMKLTAIGLVLGRVFSVAGILVLIVLGLGHSAAAIALVWLAAGVIFSICLSKAVWRQGIWPYALDRQLLRRMVRFSLPMIAFAGSQYVIQAIDILILGVFRPQRDVGVYAIAYQGYGVLQQIATTATIVLSPLLVSLRVADRQRLIARFYERTVAQVLFICAVGIGIVAPLLKFVVPMIFSASFTAAAAPLTVLLIAWLLFAAASFVAPVLVLHERSRAIGLISMVAALVNVFGDLLLIGAFGVGIVGPAIATAASLLVVAVGYFVVAANCLHVPVARPVGVCVPAVVGVVGAFALHGSLGVVVCSTATMATAAVVLVVCKPFVRADADILGRLDLPGPVRQVALRWLERSA